MRCIVAGRYTAAIWGAARTVAAVLMALTLAVDFSLQAAAQPAPTITPEQLQRLQGQRQSQGSGATTSVLDANLPPSVTLQPAVPAQASAQLSRLEEIMSSRAGLPLHQYGYDQLGEGRSVTVPQTGAVADDYVLGPGDEVVISLRGQENAELRATVDRNGQIVLPRLAPIAATGRSFGGFRQDLEAAVHRTYVATDASVSIGRVRQISVLVAGQVNNPGQRLLTGLSTAMDALQLSGGVKKTGSLRAIRVQRGDHTYMVDLYGVFTNGGGSSFHLADGDRIVVPSLGRTVAVAGLVREQGIYELPAGRAGMSAAQILNLAGGEEVRGNYNLSVLRIMPDGRSQLVALTRNAEVRDSEILFVQLGADQATGLATLAGGVGLAGRYPITPGTRLSDLLKAPGAMGTAPYTLFGVISRKDPRTLLRNLIVFTPVLVLSAGQDIQLQSDDIVRVLSVDEIRTLTTVVTNYSDTQLRREEALHDPLGTTVDAATKSSVANTPAATNIGVLAQTNSTNFDVATRDDVARLQQSEQSATPSGKAPAAGAQPEINFEPQSLRQGQIATNRSTTTLTDLAKQLSVDDIVLANFLIDHEATLEGAIRGPGTYFVGDGVQLRDLVQAAGGTLDWTDRSNIELITTVVDAQTGRSITRRTSVPPGDTQFSLVVGRHDKFRFNKVFTDVGIGQVVIQGEVRFNGTYDITRGERLSDLLGRAGGLTNTAYPYGTIYLRRAAAAAERDGYVRTAREVEDQLIVAMTRVGSDKIEPGTFAAMQNFVTDLRNQKAIGRIAVTADPSLLAAKPNLDMLLEAGDVIYVPQRPSTIAVLGHVMQAGSFPYRADMSIDDYIARAGGFARYAETSDVFVVLPDGTARKIEKSWFSFESMALPPGSTIVVPRDITPLDLRQTIIDVSQVFSQFAVSIASVAVLARQ